MYQFLGKLQLKVFITILFFVASLNFILNASFAQQSGESFQSISENTTVEGQQLAQVSKLTNPDSAEAGFIQDSLNRIPGVSALKTAYDIWCGIKEFTGTGGRCEVNSNTWTGGMVQNLVFNTAFTAICDQDTDELIKTPGSAVCWDPNTRIDLSAIQREYPGQMVRVNGGFGLAAVGITSLAAVSDPKTAPIPTNFALFINDTLKDNIFGTQVYAQSSLLGATFDSIVLAGWKVSRNIALSMFGILLASAGLMVMLRTKLAPRVTVSIYSVLPMIPVSLAGILLSYPIISFFYGFIGPLTGLALSLGTGLIREVLYQQAANSPMSNITDVGSFAVNAAINMWTQLTIGGSFMLFLMLGTLIAVVIILFAGLYIFMRIYMSLMYIVVVSPFVALMSIIPGKQGLIINLIKNIIANVIALPIAMLMFFIGLAIIGYMPSNPGGFFGLVIAASTFGQFLFMFIYAAKFFIGLGIVWQGVKARGTAERILGTTGLFETEPKRR